MKIKNWIKRIFGIKSKERIESVFTPTKAATLNYIKRSDIEKKISRSIRIPGTQIILYGHSGAGKTTTIRNILNNSNRNFIITSCTTDSTVNELIINAFDKLNPYYKSETSKKLSSKISSNLKTSYLQIEAGLSTEYTEETSHKMIRALPVQLTYERLAEFLGAAECIWIIEDFHKVADDEKQKLSDIMKAFVDIANDYDKVKIVAIGAVSSAREVVMSTPNIQSRLSEIHIPLLKNDELRQIIQNGAKILNIEFDNKLVDHTIYYSNSLGSLCHQLCYSHCEQMEVLESQKQKITIPYKVLENSIEDYVSQKSDTFQQKLDRALKQRKAKFENVKLILSGIISIGKEEVTFNEIYSKIKEWEPDYPQGNLTVYLQPLTTSKHDEIIRYDENSGRYAFSDPFFKAYCSMSLDPVKNNRTVLTELDEHLDSIIKKLQKIMDK
jgi:Cdc6-like AAA superfamily ATPase